ERHRGDAVRLRVTKRVAVAQVTAERFRCACCVRGALAGTREEPRVQRLVLAACLLFSGLCALIDQLVWTRWLGLSFGTTTEAIAAVLSVFFGGLALGNWLAARRLARVARPLRVYVALEAAIGVFALLSLPLLRRMG